MGALDVHTKYPQEMLDYIENYGFNFNKKACDFAVRLMKRNNAATGKKEPIEPMSKEQVEEVLTKNGVRIENSKLYNHVFVMNMAKADYWKSSIEDERHLALFVKDYIDDADGCEELPFRRWLASMRGCGNPIDWSDLI